MIQQEGDNMLYVFIGNNEGEAFVEQSRQFLSRQRTERLDAVRALSDKVNCCAAYLLLRYALYKEYGMTDAPVFGYKDREKPFLSESPEIHFNLSHCKNAAACIVSGSNTAVDIMEKRKLHSNVHKRVCSEQELHILEESSDPDLAFIQLWTRKECYSKLTGLGLAMDFRTITDSLPEMEHIHTVIRDDLVLTFFSEHTPENIIYTTGDELIKFHTDAGLYANM